MKVSKNTILCFIPLVMVLAFSMQAHADLNLIGTATYNSSDYNLIYDDDLNVTWLDYSNAIDNWDNQVGWAAGLNTADVLTYNFNPGVTMTWSDDWRLPTTVDGPWVHGYDGTTTGGYNITSSEMGHLFYTELGNDGAYETSGDPTGCSSNSPWCLTNTGDFQNLQPFYYWSGTEYATNTDYVWDFSISHGFQNLDNKSSFNFYALAVRPGLAVVPEPISSTLFMVGGAALGFRRFRKKRKLVIRNLAYRQAGL